MPDSIVIQEHDVGLQFLIHLLDKDGNPVDVSGFTDFLIYFRRPDHTTFQVPATFYSNGTDGLIQYVTQAGDLDLTGQWGIQASYSLSHSTIYTSKDTFIVSADIIDGV